MIVIFRCCVELILRDRDLRDADVEKCRTGHRFPLPAVDYLQIILLHTHLINRAILLFFLFIHRSSLALSEFIVYWF